VEEEPELPWRDRELEERARYEFLLRLYLLTGADVDRVMPAREVGRQIGLAPVETFAVVEFLAHGGYIDYLGAGPRIRLALRGVHYIEWGAHTRRTVRD